MRPIWAGAVRPVPAGPYTWALRVLALSMPSLPATHGEVVMVNDRYGVRFAEAVDTTGNRF